MKKLSLPILLLATLLNACGSTEAPAPEPETQTAREEAPGTGGETPGTGGETPEQPPAATEAPGAATTEATPGGAAGAGTDGTAGGASGGTLSKERNDSKAVASIKPVKNASKLAPLSRRTTLPMETSKSSVEWVAVKNGEVEITGRFTALAGSLSVDPKDLRTATGEIGIDLLGVSTGDDKRDANISTVFFGTTKKSPIHGQISVTSIQPEALTLAVGESTKARGLAGINLGGTVIAAMLPLQIERVADTYWKLSLLEPLEVGIDELGMDERAAALLKLCGHKSIGNAVKATGTVFFGEDR